MMDIRQRLRDPLYPEEGRAPRAPVYLRNSKDGAESAPARRSRLRELRRGLFEDT